MPLYSMVGYASLEDLAGFRLDSPRDKSFRCVVCFLSRADADGLRIHKLECMEHDFCKLCKHMRSSLTATRSGCVDLRQTTPTTKARTSQAVSMDASLEDA